jgi:hypothetical protein
VFCVLPFPRCRRCNGTEQPLPILYVLHLAAGSAAGTSRAPTKEKKKRSEVKCEMRNGDGDDGSGIVRSDFINFFFKLNFCSLSY